MPTTNVIAKIELPTIVITIILFIIPIGMKTIKKNAPYKIIYRPIQLQQQLVLQIKVFEFG